MARAFSCVLIIPVTHSGSLALKWNEVKSAFRRRKLQAGSQRRKSQCLLSGTSSLQALGTLVYFRNTFHSLSRQTYGH